MSCLWCLARGDGAGDRSEQGPQEVLSGQGRCPRKASQGSWAGRADGQGQGQGGVTGTGVDLVQGQVRPREGTVGCTGGGGQAEGQPPRRGVPP